MIKRIVCLDGTVYTVGEGGYINDGVVEDITNSDVSMGNDNLFLVSISNGQTVYIPFHAVARWMVE